MTTFFNRIVEKYQFKYLKALQVYPVTERGENAIGIKIDEETLDELMTQLMIAKQAGGKEFGIKAFRSDKRLFITVEKFKGESEQ